MAKNRLFYGFFARFRAIFGVLQRTICFLYQYVGHNVHEIYGKDCKGKEISIKLACYREVDSFISLLRNRMDRRETVVEAIDFTDYKALLMDPVNCFNRNRQIIRNMMILLAYCSYPYWDL